MLWILSVLIGIAVISGLTSSRARLDYYRLKDFSLERIGETLYRLSHRDAIREVRIVCLGDSMSDDMPEQPLMNRLFRRHSTWIEMLRSKLRETYPNMRIFVHNHGAKSRRISTALARMEHPYERENHYGRFTTLPSVNQIGPDIIILESHGYMDHDTDYEQYVRTFKEILRLSTEEMGAEIYLVVTICPDSEDLKKPYEYYVNDRPRRVKEAQLIRQRLEDALELGLKLGIPTIDVYSKTAQNPRPFIKEQDMVHPSYRGHQLIAAELFEHIKNSEVFVSEEAPSTMAGYLSQKGSY